MLAFPVDLTIKPTVATLIGLTRKVPCDVGTFNRPALFNQFSYSPELFRINLTGVIPCSHIYDGYLDIIQKKFSVLHANSE